MVDAHFHPTRPQAPAGIRFSGPIVRRLLRFGVPLGPNTLLTVRGRTTGRPLTQPLAVAELDGRRFVIGTFGDVNWCRNLRAAGEADLVIGGETVHVNAVELTQEQAATFFREELPAYLGRLKFLWRLGVRLLVRLAAPEIFTDPDLAAQRRPVFELTRMVVR